jgi:hypothetical protein
MLPLWWQLLCSCGCWAACISQQLAWKARFPCLSQASCDIQPLTLAGFVRAASAHGPDQLLRSFGCAVLLPFTASLLVEAWHRRAAAAAARSSEEAEEATAAATTIGALGASSNRAGARAASSGGAAKKHHHPSISSTDGGAAEGGCPAAAAAASDAPAVRRLRDYRKQLSAKEGAGGRVQCPARFRSPLQRVQVSRTAAGRAC